MDKKESALKIIELVGGSENIINVWHCMTRLRFDLLNIDLIKEDEIKALDGVLGTQFAKKQFQIVLGTTVNTYYEIIANKLGVQEVSGSNEPKPKKDIATWFMDMVSGVFGPIVPAIAGAGMIKGLIGGLVALKVIDNTTPTFQVIDMLASSVFVFLPFFIAISAAKKFKTNEYLALAIAATIMFPTMVDAAKLGEVKQFLFAGFIPVPVFNYSGSVIPIIFAVLALSYIYKFIDKHMPDALKPVATPTFALFIAGFFALSVIGPIGIYLGKGLAEVVNALFDISPLLAGLVIGILRPIAVLTGMHHAMTPIALQNFANQGWDMLMPMMFVTNIAIVGAASACYFKEKSQRDKAIAVSAVVSGVLGITEPALFGILTKYKKAFVAAIVGSSLASAFISVFGVKLYAYITSSVFSIPAYIGPHFIWAMIGWIIAFGVSFTLAYMFVVNSDDETIPNENIVNNESNEIYAPMSGEIIPLSSVNDEVFSKELMGKGIAINTDKDLETLTAPINGTISCVFPGGHAIGIRSIEGLEVLIHIGLETVELNGEPFTLQVKEGQNVTIGEDLVTVNFSLIKSKKLDPITLLVITNSKDYTDFQIEYNQVNQLDKIISVK